MKKIWKDSNFIIFLYYFVYLRRFNISVAYKARHHDEFMESN